MRLFLGLSNDLSPFATMRIIGDRLNKNVDEVRDNLVGMLKSVGFVAAMLNYPSL